jgi:Reverse transcriptase (RNA-dependent DNA polymerase)
LVKAGYVNNGKFSNNNLGVPQGGIISPLLSNIYLHEFDKFMDNLISQYSSDLKIKVSKPNPKYSSIRQEIKKLELLEEDLSKRNSKLKELKRLLIKTPSVIRNNDTGKRLFYNRYADDWIVGLSGTKEDAESIKKDIINFLTTKLELTINETKTKITHVGKKRIQYLGFEIGRHSRKYTESQISIVKSTGVKRRPSYASVIIYAPKRKIIENLIDHGFA